MRTSRLSLYLAGAVLALPCLAVTPPAVPVSSGTTLQQAVDSAWLRAPAARTLEARREETVAARINADSWLATNPTLGLAQRVNRGASERDQTESEISVSSSIWLPGQKSARTTLAMRSTDEVVSQLAATRLEIAGAVRNRIWDAAAAKLRLEEKRDRLHYLEGLAKEVRQRAIAGDLARSDDLLAAQEVLAARIDELDAATVAAEALSRYRVLTGMSELPPLEPETLSDGVLALDPRLVAAHASERRAHAVLGLATASRASPPTVTLSVRREDERTLRQPANSIGLALQIPIGGAARNRVVEAQAQTTIATAAAEAAQLSLTAAAERDIARERLAAARRALAAATSRAAALHEHVALIEKAFRHGERGLADVLRSRALMHEADIAAGQQQIALGLAHALYNQAFGLLP